MTAAQLLTQQLQLFYLGKQTKDQQQEGDREPYNLVQQFNARFVHCTVHSIHTATCTAHTCTFTCALNTHAHTHTCTGLISLTTRLRWTISASGLGTCWATLVWMLSSMSQHRLPPPPLPLDQSPSGPEHKQSKTKARQRERQREVGVEREREVGVERERERLFFSHSSSLTLLLSLFSNLSSLCGHASIQKPGHVNITPPPPFCVFSVRHSFLYFSSFVSVVVSLALLVITPPSPLLSCHSFFLEGLRGHQRRTCLFVFCLLFDSVSCAQLFIGTSPHCGAEQHG